MKFKHLLIISLMLTVLVVGVVSASNVTDDLAVNVSIDDSIAIEDNNQDLISGGDDSNDVSQSNPYESAELYLYPGVYTNEDSVYFGSVRDSPYIDGIVTLTIDGTQYFRKSYSNGNYGEISVDSSKLPTSLKTGKHSLVLAYLKNGVKTPFSINKDVDFIYEPSISYTIDIATGERAMINIAGFPGTTGTAKLYNYNESSRKTGSIVSTISISNGKGQIIVKDLTKGTHEFFLEMKIDGQSFDQEIKFEVHDNSAGYNVISTPQITVGDDVIVTFSGPKTNGTVYIYVDGVEVKNIEYFGETLRESISGISVGQHMISVEYNDGEDFFYKSLNVKVSPKYSPSSITLALKKVTVKKSAKKLSLKASLKINKKAVKGKKITFKFNGKKFTAKTNKKGVAKATISAKILKKLNVGKKITYSASYGNKTKKLTVKVKK